MTKLCNFTHWQVCNPQIHNLWKLTWIPMPFSSWADPKYVVYSACLKSDSCQHSTTLRAGPSRIASKVHLGSLQWRKTSSRWVLNYEWNYYTIDSSVMLTFSWNGKRYQRNLLKTWTFIYTYRKLKINISLNHI